MPLLAEVAAGIGDVQIRSRATIGSVAYADPAGEYATVCLMPGAEILTSTRRMAACGVFAGRVTPVPDPGERPAPAGCKLHLTRVLARHVAGEAGRA